MLEEATGIVEELEEEEIEIEAFMVEDRDPTDDVCITCSKLRNDGKVCGIYKALDTFRKSKGVSNTDETFYCNEFEAAE